MNSQIHARYEQAQRIIDGTLSTRLVQNDCVFPHWIEESESFWYIRDTKVGKDYRLVNAEEGTNNAAFDHQVLASALANVTGQAIDPLNLPIIDISFNLTSSQVLFTAFEKRWVFCEKNKRCREIACIEKTEGILSPDGKKQAFIKDYNLWVREIATGIERALTEDGRADFCYASTTYSVDLEAAWSPDSCLLFTHQLDMRKVASVPFIRHVPQNGKAIRPELEEQKMAYAGDVDIETYRLVVIDVESGEVKTPNIEPIPLLPYFHGFFSREKLGWWASDSRRVNFVNLSRGAKSAQVMEFDVLTSTTRVLFEETSNTFLKLSHDICFDAPLLLPLPESDELIWFSERSGLGHLYLYDMKAGKLEQAITEGQWLVRNLLHFDAQRRELMLQTAGRDATINPYYRDICRVNIDSGELTELVTRNYEYRVFSPESAEVGTRKFLGFDSPNVSGVSPSGQHVVTTYSRVDTVPETVLVNRDGQIILTVETADVANLPEDWCWPEPVTTTGADGKTEIYGTVYWPLGFSENESYPVLDFSCGHVMNSYVPQASFNNSVYSEPYLLGMAYAALGFVVVALEGRGTSGRSKAFQDYSYGRMASASAFEDRIAGIQQLAKRSPCMDTGRVGLISCDSFTGPVYGLLEHPEFYKAGVMVCLGDARFEGRAVSDQFEGFTTKSDNHYAEEMVQSLKGKLLLIHGMMDRVTPVMSTMRLIGALQNANKDFDMLLLPNDGHEISSYAQRKTWDYLVTHLQNIEPPKEFPFVGTFDRLLN